MDGYLERKEMSVQEQLNNLYSIYEYLETLLTPAVPPVLQRQNACTLNTCNCDFSFYATQLENLMTEMVLLNRKVGSIMKKIENL